MTDYASSAARFAAETRGHKMTVLLDQGLYRHLAFTDPAGSFYRFDLVTWPHNLMVRGDGFSFAFSVHPTVDLFRLFRESKQADINPGYWQEKVTAGRGDVTDWSEEKFRAWVIEEAAAAEARFPGAVEAVTEQILDSEDHNLEYRGTAEYAVGSFDHGDFRLRIPDHWEESFDDFSWEFLFACRAIVWGIGQYDASICGSRCPEHADHYCRRSPKHQPGICRDVKQKGFESCTWNPARKAVLR
ncbi:hypothetical protein [Streptomyces sp. NPDC020747]|uniref:hypothetical protein n=1 Tax=Streptomyces sp. NPDC020747 TaxID=3365086 RepID=UPI00379F123D